MAQPNYYYSRCRGLAVQLKIRWNLGGCSSDLHWWCDGLDIKSGEHDPKSNLTLPLFRVVLIPRFTRPFCAVPRTSVVRTASG